MATLKSLLNATLKASSKWGLPKGNAVTIWTASTHATDTESWADRFTYVAPKDGIVYAYNVNWETCYIHGITTGTASEFNSLASGNNICRTFWAFCKKGDSVVLTAFNRTATTTAYFYPLLGQV